MQFVTIVAGTFVMTFKQRDIEDFIEQEKRLPSTHRHGFNGGLNDVAEGADGEPISVPKPENPEDRYN